MAEIDLARLCKVLSLTNSDKEGEAIAAFLMARRLLAKSGLAFEDLPALGAGDRAARDMALKDLELASLRKQVVRLQAELVEKEAALERHEDAFAQVLDSAWTLADAAERDTVKGPVAN